MKIGRYILYSWASVSLAISARAAVTIEGIQQGNDVRFSYSGSLDLTGAVFNYNFNYIGYPSRIVPALGYFTAADGLIGFYTLVQPFGSFGPALYSNGSSFSGTDFAVDVDVYLPADYQSGDPIEGEALFTKSTFESLGVVPGTYTALLPNDSITLKIVPEPESTILTVVGAMGLLCTRTRKRTRRHS